MEEERVSRRCGLIILVLLGGFVSRGYRHQSRRKESLFTWYASTSHGFMVLEFTVWLMAAGYETVCLVGFKTVFLVG